MKKVGLIGGLSWVSTLDYYTFINKGVNAQLGGLNFAEILIYSLNFGKIQSATWPQSFRLLLRACESMKKAGAEAIALCANTAHLFADRLEDEVGLPVIHIVSETAKAIQKTGLKKVGLLGTKFVMEMDFYKHKLEEYGLEVLVPEDQETRDYIQYTVKEELGAGLVKPKPNRNILTLLQTWKRKEQSA
ncbi:aspartate/glutamate racemase family protein [Chryseobacterium camelliae]|uniref:aspartate/glutamate racemase family protein n=1 Tax=Chryseobacterium camelliae TaxID=1265445 RepID=UPI00285EE949|nr:amino acid racemase [Chryseobacterium camelliae]MDR6516740.1 aspartate racemase [Chryseobacterium camelliae]